MDKKVFRYSLGCILLALILAAFYFSKAAVFIVSIIFIIMAMAEYRGMFRYKNIYPHMLIPEIIGIVLAYNFIFGGYIVGILTAGCIISFIITVIFNKKPYILTSMITITAIFFIFCGLYIIKLATIDGISVILVYFSAVLAGDYLASIIGPKIKSIHISPEISPNKTLAGSIANIIAAVLICLLLHKFIGLSILKCIFAGLIVSFTSQMGDLTISTFKRDLGIKHSGALFLGYGGILDRTDAFIFSAPALYYTLLLI